jgi:hypothetical protein
MDCCKLRHRLIVKGKTRVSDLDLLVSRLCPWSAVLKTLENTFHKLNLFPFSGEGGGGRTPTLLGLIERANCNHWTSNPECYTPSTESHCLHRFPNPLLIEECYWILFYKPSLTFSHHLLNVLLQLANKWGLKKMYFILIWYEHDDSR